MNSILEGSWNHEYYGSLGFIYFARASDPKYSWFHEPSKNRIHFLNKPTKIVYTIWISYKIFSKPSGEAPLVVNFDSICRWK